MSFTTERRATDILDWLAPISSLQKHSDVQLKRASGTGDWFLQSPQLISWIEGQSVEDDLLCIGGPGVGKTVLTYVNCCILAANANTTSDHWSLINSVQSTKSMMWPLYITTVSTAKVKLKHPLHLPNAFYVSWQANVEHSLPSLPTSTGERRTASRIKNGSPSFKASCIVLQPSLPFASW